MKNVKLSSAIQSYHKLLTQSQFKIKHVRVLIIYTHQFKTSIYDLIDSESKQLQRSIRIPILLFKVIQQGHLLNTLEITRLEKYCFGPLGDLLRVKIKLHTTYHEFDGQLKYEEFIALKYSQVVDVGFNVLSMLLEYLQKSLIAMQHYLNQLSTTSQNTELLVLMTCFILESYNTYIYILHIGRAVHKRIADVDALSQIRSDYKSRTDSLKQLFDQCRRWKQLLIYMDIPHIKYLDLMEFDDLEQMEQIEFRDIDDNASEVSFGMTHDDSLADLQEPQYEPEPMPQPIQQPIQQPQYIPQQQPQQRIEDSPQYLEQQQIIQSLQLQLQQLQSKYSQLAQLYQQLRTEHIQLLDKYNQLSQSHDPNANQRLKEKQLQLANMMRERDEFKLKWEQGQLEVQDKLRDIRRENELLQLQLKQVKTDGTSPYVDQIKKMQNELQQTQQLLNNKNKEFLGLQGQLATTNQQMASQSEELEVLQLSLDQALLSMQNGQNSQQDTMVLARELDNVLDNMLMIIMQQIGNTIQSRTNEHVQLNPVFIALLDAYPLDTTTQSIMEWLNSNNRTVVMQPIIQLGFKTLVLLDYKVPEQIGQLLVEWGQLVREYVGQLLSSQLVRLNLEQRIQLVNKQHNNVKQKRMEILQACDQLSTPNKQKDLPAVMNLAQTTMANALSTLQGLLKLNLNGVHARILEQCILLAQQLDYFVQCCIHTQNEIIGASETPQDVMQFYKKHNRWTQGLISAAQVNLF